MCSVNCTTNAGEFPFSALIGRTVRKQRGFLTGNRPIIVEENEWFCSGVLLNSQFVLTAAHCKTEDDYVKLRLGVHDVPGYGADDESKYQNFDIGSRNFVTHEDYRNQRRGEVLRVKHDIALIKLPREAKFNQFVQPACWEGQPSLSDKLSVVGWGKVNAYQISTINGVFSTEQRALQVTNDFKD